MNYAKRDTDKLKYLEPMITSIFWVILFASPLLFGNSDNGINWQHIFHIWESFILYLILFLINRFILLPYLFFRNKRALYFASALLLIILISGGGHLIEKGLERNDPEFSSAPPRPQHEFSDPLYDMPDLPPGEHHEPPRGRKPPQQLPPILSFFIVSILIVGFDTGLNISMKWAQSEKNRVNAEKENIESQLAFLRNQVSPHFFMNTLNNIHALIDQDKEEAKESIISLSKLMRHLLYDSEIDKIPLKKEIDFIANYVDLMKMRYSDKVNIKLILPDQHDDRLIPPLLFTSFLENAFKHGISYQKASYIDIRFLCAQNALTFEISNSCHAKKVNEKSSGIGIANSLKRLDLLYGNCYSLNINQDGNEYKLTLTIPL